MASPSVKKLKESEGKTKMAVEKETITVVRSFFNEKLEKEEKEATGEFTPYESVEEAEKAIPQDAKLRILNAGLRELCREQVEAKIEIPAGAVSEEAVKSMMKTLVPIEQQKGASLVDARAKVMAKIRSSKSLLLAIQAIDAEIKSAKTDSVEASVAA